MWGVENVLSLIARDYTCSRILLMDVVEPSRSINLFLVCFRYRQKKSREFVSVYMYILSELELRPVFII